jgi:CRP-like cAMP-binding protein
MTDQKAGSANAELRANRFLSRMGEEDLSALAREAKIVKLKLHKRMLLQDANVDAVYFPLTCMFSLLVNNRDGPSLEMATIGKEGVMGASEAFQMLGSVGLTIVQIPGKVLRIEAEAFRRFIQGRTAVQQLIHQHTYALMRQILYGASCNRIHSMEERCARWLLMTNDRAGEDTFPITQDFLAHMLGVRRATVNVAIGMLKKAGFIGYIRGVLTVIDRGGLESASCACYMSIRGIYDAFFPLVSPIV